MRFPGAGISSYRMTSNIWHPMFWGHRIILPHSASVGKKLPAEIIKSIVKDIAVPVNPEQSEA